MPGSWTQAYSSSTNRMSSAGATAFGYDANGNMATAGGLATYTYSPQNMLETGGGATYRYDGGGVRKSKTSGGTTRYYLRGPAGQILSEMTSQTCRARDSVYAGSRLLATVRSEEPTVNLPSAGAWVGEEELTALVPVTLTVPDGCPPGQAVTVDFATQDGTATAGSDYVAQAGTLTFDAGSPSGSTLPIEIQILDDVVQEPSEGLVVTLTGTSGATLGVASHSVMILDDEPVPPTLTLAGGASGTVTSQPAGIDCPATCSGDSAVGTPVTLTATPAEGASFTGWTQACTGTGPTRARDAPNTTTAHFDPPVLSVSDATNTEGDTGTTTLTFRLTLGPPPAVPRRGASGSGGHGTRGDPVRSGPGPAARLQQP